MIRAGSTPCGGETTATEARFCWPAPTDGRNFSTPADLSGLSAPAQTAFQPAVAVGLSGVVYVAYIVQSTNPTMRDVFLIRSTDQGKTFSAPENVSRSNSATRWVSTVSPVALALDAGDNPHLAWLTTASPGQDIFYTRSRDGGATFDPPVNASNGNSPLVLPREPALAVEFGTGVAYVAWTNVDATRGLQDILISTSADGGSFTTINNLSSSLTYFTAATADRPALGIDNAGVLTAVWRQLTPDLVKRNDTQQDIYSSRSSDGPHMVCAGEPEYRHGHHRPAANAND